MKVVLAFWGDRDRTPDTMQYLMYGKYSSCCFLFVEEDDIYGFYSVPGGEYKRYTFKCGFYDSEFICDFLLISVDEEEKLKLRATCEACVLVKKPFNMQDVVLMCVPLLSLKELSIDEAPTLNNSQAMVLFLRGCLDKENPLRKALEGLNSRQTYMDDLYERLAPHALPVMWSSLAGQLRKS